MSAKITSLRKVYIFLALAALAYFIFWMSQALPYRLFPTDDAYFRSFIDQPGIKNRILMIIRSHHPVLLISLAISKMIWFLFSRDLSSALLFHTVISNSIIIFILGAIILRLTQDRFSVIIGVILYATSAWPVNYSFFYSYASFTAMLSLAVFFFILKAYFTPEKRGFFIAAAGIVSGLYFWSSPSSMVTISLYFLISVYLFKTLSQEDIKKTLSGYFTYFLAIVIPFIPLSSLALAPHLLENCRQYGNPEIIRTPFFSFFYILGTYNKWLLIYFWVSCFLLAVLIIKKYTAKEKISVLREYKVVFSLAALIWAHSVFIDILPSTKLARTNFVIYPLFIVAVVCLFYFLSARLVVRYLRYWHIFSFLLLILGVWANIRFCRELIRVKGFTPRYLTSHLADIQLYALEEDAHADSIIAWLEDFHIRKIKKSEMDTVLSRNKQSAFIVGPRGKGSGQSILANCCLDDFIWDDLDDYLRRGKLKELPLPYFAYFPSFLIEEETCEGLYFSGKRLDYKLDSRNIGLLLPNKEGR